MLKQCLLTLVTGSLLALIAGSASADIYTWKDANGRVQYSDQPPPDVDAKLTHGTAKPVADKPSAAQSDAKAAPAPKSMADKDLEFRQRLADQADKAAKQKEEDARKAEKDNHCKDLHNNLAMMERGGRIGAPNAQGEMEYYTDDRIKQEGDNLRTRIAKECP